jgi:hypothetical protein
MTTRKRRKTKKRIEKIIELAAEAGSMAMSLRDKPTRLDWLSLGLRSVSLAIRVHSERCRELAKDPWDFFEEEDEQENAKWLPVPSGIGKLVLDQVRDVCAIEEYWDQEDDSEQVLVGKIRNEKVGWLADAEGKLIDGPYVLQERLDETYRAFGDSLWREFSTHNLLYSSDGLCPDPFSDKGILPTGQFQRLASRTAIFLEKGIARSLLFAGPPGTGKSTGMRSLAESLGLRTLRVDIKVLTERHRTLEVTTSIDTLVRALSPEVLILDDVDRVKQEEQLLHFAELANRKCKLVLASVNELEGMSEALKRPGRFDEIVEVLHPDPRVVRTLLGADCDLAPRLLPL